MRGREAFHRVIRKQTSIRSHPSSMLVPTGDCHCFLAFYRPINCNGEVNQSITRKQMSKSLIGTIYMYPDLYYLYSLYSISYNYLYTALLRAYFNVRYFNIP